MPSVLTARLESMTPYSPSRMHDEPKLTKEAGDAYDLRTWHLHAHCDDKGRLYIPSMAFKFALMEAARRDPRKIKGRGSSTYSGAITSGLDVVEDLTLLDANGSALLIKDVIAQKQMVTINAHAQGKRTDGSRVQRRFPLIPAWRGDLTVHVYDSIITEDVLLDYLRVAGGRVGVGRFRPEKGGYNGRFTVEASKWEEIRL